MPNPFERDRDQFEADDRQPGADFRDDLLNGAYLPNRSEHVPYAVDFSTVMEQERLAINLRRAAYNDPEGVQIFSAQTTAVSSSSVDRRVEAIGQLAELEPAACYPVALHYCSQLQAGVGEQGWWERTKESMRDWLPGSWFSSSTSERKLSAEGLVAICREVELEECAAEVIKVLRETALDANNTNSLRIVALRALLLTSRDEAYEVFESLDNQATSVSVRKAAHFAMNAFDILRSPSDREEYFNRLSPKW